MPTPISYPQLLDKAWVLEKLKSMSQEQLAKEIGSPHSSVAWVVKRYFTPEERAQIKLERKHKPREDKIPNIPQGDSNG